MILELVNERVFMKMQSWWINKKTLISSSLSRSVSRVSNTFLYLFCFGGVLAVCCHLAGLDFVILTSGQSRHGNCSRANSVAYIKGLYFAHFGESSITFFFNSNTHKAPRWGTGIFHWHNSIKSLNSMVPPKPLGCTVHRNAGPKDQINRRVVSGGASNIKRATNQ